MTSPDKLQLAFVSIDKKTEKMLFSFRFGDEYVKDRVYSINRTLDEAIEASLAR